MGESGWTGGQAPWIALLLVASAAAHAQESVTAAREVSPHDVFQARLRYGAAVRSGSQTQAANPRLSYAGVTPNDLGLELWGWFLVGSHVGASLSLQREAFALYDAGARVTGGGLIRFSVGPAGRVTLGPVKLEGVVGYAFDQLPTFGTAASPAFSAGTRHGVLLAARGIVDLGPVGVEVKGKVPISLAATDGAGRTATASGYDVGGGLRVQLLRTGSLRWGLLADVSYVTDVLDVAGAGGLHGNQYRIRAGGAVDLKWQDPPAPEAPRYGDLEIRVVDASTGRPMPGAAIDVGTQQLVADATGVAKVMQLVPGAAVAAKASAGGYLPAEAQGTITADTVLTLELKLAKEPPKVGSVAIQVIRKEAATPIAGAKVKLGERTAITDAEGRATFDGLAPGPLGISITAEGFNPGEEAASVVAGQASDVTVGMVEVKQRIPATITGLVRSTAGKPVAAELEIPQAQIKTRANASGAFTFRLDGGTYTVNISARGYLTQSKSVTVKDGDQAIFNVDLHPK